MTGAWLPLLLLAGGSVWAQAPQPKTVLDGIYSSAQAGRGKAAYTRSCAGCHGADLTGFSGPPLKGAIFLDRWREFPSNVLYELMRTSMPKDASAPLPESAYLEIFSHLLAENEIPAGTAEMTVDVLSSTLLVGKLGPQPLPSSAQVGVVGCLTLEVGTGWFLTNATEPFRAIDGFDVSAAELAEAKTSPLGGALFRLQGITDLPNLDVKTLENRKVEVKGILVRQAKGDRINVTAAKVANSSCEE